jgi:hypothetical protein
MHGSPRLALILRTFADGFGKAPQQDDYESQKDLDGG